ncbi:hypothetical protein [Acinetobacter sp. ANC 5378]|uniref:Bbp19 family protein n=1 Tax=Acinetobacter sp. ANC 5378 TaxID=2731249 RepID=UPI00148FAFB1|nr:hypothetical protein [Acinetobacter sp. ANC 5378]
MILIIAVLAILLLIACVGLHVLNEGVKESHDVAENYRRDWLKGLDKCRELEAELSERPLPAQPEEEPEQGNFVRTRTLKRATPETYRNVFDMDLNGQRVLEHLTMVFCKEAFVSNDKGGERETCHRLGQQSVINFIVNSINQANNPNYKEEVND